jgi:hypothetical protein
MTYFAYTLGQEKIYQFDTANQSVAPLLLHDLLALAPNQPSPDFEANIRSISVDSSNNFFFKVRAQGVSVNPYQIRHTDSFQQSSLVSTSSLINRVRVRNVGGADRVYFSVMTTAQDVSMGEIYYLEGATPKLYTTIDKKKLTWPNPCDPLNGVELYDWVGDFCFDDADNLYLSTGNWEEPKVGIYRIAGAGANSVTGDIERICLHEGPIVFLSYQAPQTLYFYGGSQDGIYKLDLSTMTVTFVAGPLGIPMWGDVIYMAQPASYPYWYVFYNFFYRFSVYYAKAVRQFGERMTARSRAKFR